MNESNRAVVRSKSRVVRVERTGQVKNDNQAAENKQSGLFKANQSDRLKSNKPDRTGLDRACQSLSRILAARREYALHSVPNPLEFLGYIYCFSSILAGPAFEYKEYINAVTCKAYEKVCFHVLMYVYIYIIFCSSSFCLSQNEVGNSGQLFFFFCVLPLFYLNCIYLILSTWMVSTTPHYLFTSEYTQSVVWNIVLCLIVVYVFVSFVYFRAFW